MNERATQLHVGEQCATTSPHNHISTTIGLDGQTLIPTMGETFDWNYPGLNWSHFHCLANLLSLRSGGQAEPSSLPDTVFEEDWDAGGDAASIDTRLAHRISDSGYEKLSLKGGFSIVWLSSRLIRRVGRRLLAPL